MVVQMAMFDGSGTFDSLVEGKNRFGPLGRAKHRDDDERPM